MAKIVFTPLAGAKRIKSNRVKTKRQRGADGKMVTVSILNADSSTFGDDLSHVFRKNVKKARRANKTLRRTPNGVSAKI
jgi:hypothetical protein